MTKFLVSPAEHSPQLRALGPHSSFPEQFGADIAWIANGQIWGVQRKEVKDFLASVDDGRLTREKGQMASLHQAVLILEGPMTYTTEGWLREGTKIGTGFGRDRSFEEIMGLLVGLQAEGIWVVRSANIGETVQLCRVMAKWAAKTKHQSLKGRPGIERGPWGRPTNMAFAVYMLSGLPGCGPEMATRVAEEFNGLPWTWVEGVGVERLMQIPGIGKKRAEQMMSALKARGLGFLGDGDDG